MLIRENEIRRIIKSLLLSEYSKASAGKANYNSSIGRGLKLEEMNDEKYSFNDLPFSYSQVSMSSAAAIAEELHQSIGAASPKVKEGTTANHKIIVDLIHKPAYKMFRGKFASCSNRTNKGIAFAQSSFSNKI